MSRVWEKLQDERLASATYEIRMCQRQTFFLPDMRQEVHAQLHLNQSHESNALGL